MDFVYYDNTWLSLSALYIPSVSYWGYRDMPNPHSLQNGKRASEPQPLPELLKDKAHLWSLTVFGGVLWLCFNQLETENLLVEKQII